MANRKKILVQAPSSIFVIHKRCISAMSIFLTIAYKCAAANHGSCAPCSTLVLELKNISVADLALFPGARKVGRSSWYTLFVHVRLSPGFSGELGNFRKIYSVTLTSFLSVDFSSVKDACHRPSSVKTMTRKRLKHSALRLQKLFARLSIPGKHCGT